MRSALLRLVAITWITWGLTTPLNADTHAYLPDAGGSRALRVAADLSFSTARLGGQPYGAAVTPNGRRALFTRTAAATVTVIPVDTFAAADSQVHIAVGTAPRGVAVTSNGQFAFVANFEDDTVSQISLASLTVVDTIDVGSGPWGVAALHDADDNTHRVYVTNFLEDSISVITGDGTTTIADVGDGPLGAALTPDGQWLYVANFNAATVAVIRTRDHSRFATVAVGEGPFGVAVGSQGESVFVTNSLSDSVSVIRTSDNSIERVYRVGNRPMGVAAPVNADYAYVVNSLSNTVTRIDHDEQSLEVILAGELNGATALGAFFGGPPPAAPGNLTVSTGSSIAIELRWTDNADDELGFAIERRRSSQDRFAEIARVPANRQSFSDNNLQSDTAYVYRVRAFNETGFSSYTTTSEATTDESDFSWCFIGTLLR